LAEENDSFSSCSNALFVIIFFNLNIFGTYVQISANGERCFHSFIELYAIQLKNQVLKIDLSTILFIYLFPYLFIYLFIYFFFETDIDECQTDDHECHSNADCLNSIGSYTCQCKPGFNGSGFSCECKYISKWRRLQTANLRISGS